MKRVFALLLGWVLACESQALVRFENYKSTEFAPAHGQSFEIPFRLDAKASVEITILSPDGDVVRKLRTDQPLTAGVHTLRWDGKDDAGQVVPDEAYVPVLAASAGKKRETVDPRQASGGEALEDLKVEITPGREIAYALPVPARVLIRVGAKGGPMLRSLANWAPKSAGKNIQRWDGKDAEGVVDIRELKELAVLVTGFKLPEHAIIATGNREMAYPAYRTARRWPEVRIPAEAQALERRGVRIAKSYYSPRYQDIDPTVRLLLPEDLPRSPQGLPLVQPDQTVPVRVELAPEHRWLMDESLYEVAFFIDQEFASEEEQGYLPLTWHWKANAMKPGPHLLTVNISGFSGRVGIASLRFEVKP